MSKKYDYVLGDNHYDCGIASVMTILMHYGINPSREEIIEKLGKKNDGFSAYDLVKISKSYNIDAYGIKTDISKIKKFPVIAHTIKDKNMYHFIVIFETSLKGIKIMDPSEGIKTISYKAFRSITTGIFLVFNGNKNKKEHDNRLKKELKKLLKNNKTLVIKTIILSIIYAVLSLLFNYYLKTILSSNTYKNTLIILLLFINLSLFKNSIKYLKNRLVLNLNIKIDKDITKKVFNHIFYLPYKYFIYKTTGELMTIIEDTENFKKIVTNVFVLSFVDLLLVIVIVLYMCFINIYMALFLLIVISTSLYISIKYQHIFKDIFLRLKRLRINYTSSLINYFTSYETIKNLNVSPKIIEILESKYYNELKLSKLYEKKYYSFDYIYSLTTDFLYIMFVFISYFITIKLNLSLLNIVFFSSVFYLILGFLSNITEGISFYQVNKICINRVLDLLDIEKEVFNKNNFSTLNSISYRNVSYHNLLKDINFKFRKGDRVYITGESGIGKSTLMKMLMRYYSDYEGRILIDNIDIKNISLNFIRNHITYIGQNETLFPGSILDNLRIVEPSTKNIEKVSKITLLDKFIKENNIDYNYPISEEGDNLSGGERKKLILTRGLLHFKDMIILDEVFNEISLLEERKILENIFNEYPNKIIVVISHRNSNLDLYNKKFEIEGDGSISEII